MMTPPATDIVKSVFRLFRVWISGRVARDPKRSSAVLLPAHTRTRIFNDRLTRVVGPQLFEKTAVRPRQSEGRWNGMS